MYVSSGSSEDILREVYADVSDAVEEGLLTDATSRNALYKIHVSLGKIVNTLDEQQPANNMRASRSVSVNPERQPSEEKTMMEEPTIKEEEGDVTEEVAEEDEEEEEGTVIHNLDADEVVDEVLSETEDTQI